MRDRRPFKDHGIEQLLDLEPRAHDDERLRAVVLAELERRDMTSREEALQRRLLQGDRSAVGSERRSRTSDDSVAGAASRRPPPSRPRRDVLPPATRDLRTPQVASPPLKVTGQTDVEARYAALRATCTADAEVMARWGFTPALPEAMQDHILSGWREEVSDQPDEYGRTLRQLDGDIERIRELRKDR